MAWKTGTSPGSDMLAATAIAQYVLTIGDRDTSFLMHPTVMAGWRDESGFLQAVAAEVPVIGLGLDQLAEEAEDDDADEITPSGTSYTLTPARQTGQMEVHGLFNALDGQIDMERLALALFLGGQRRLMAQVAALFPSITAQVGSTGVALSWSVLKSAVDTNHAAGSRGIQVAMLEDKQWQDVSGDALTLGGAIEHQPEMRGFMGGSQGYSYKGRFLNGDLDIFTADSSIITTVGGGADYSGCVFGPEAFGMLTRAPVPDPSVVNAMQMGWMRAELDRYARKDKTAVVTTGYSAAAIAQNGAATEVISAV